MDVERTGVHNTFSYCGLCKYHKYIITLSLKLWIIIKGPLRGSWHASTCTSHKICKSCNLQVMQHASHVIYKSCNMQVIKSASHATCKPRNLQVMQHASHTIYKSCKMQVKICKSCNLQHALWLYCGVKLLACLECHGKIATELVKWAARQKVWR